MHEREAHQATASQLKMAKSEAKVQASAIEESTAAQKAEVRVLVCLLWDNFLLCHDCVLSHAHILIKLHGSSTHVFLFV